jgi:heptosyltransferase-2
VSRRILVVCQGWVGDVVMAQSLLKLLRRRDPDCRIDVIAPKPHGALVERMAEVSEFLAAPGGHGEFSPAAHWRMGRRLRPRRYDQAIILPGSLKSALVPFIAGAKLRTGFLGEKRYGLLNDIRHGREQMATVDSFIALGLAPGEALDGTVPRPELAVDPRSQARLADLHGIDRERPLAVLAPGAEFGVSKRWPVEYFAETARALAARGWQVATIGSPKEAEAGAAVASGCESVIDLCGKTSLGDTVDLLGLARVAVTNDSGLMHIAGAVGAHVVAMYGSTSPAKVSPLTPRADVFFLGLPCSPCRQRTCPLGHHECMTKILPSSVIAAAVAAGEA